MKVIQPMPSERLEQLMAMPRLTLKSKLKLKDFSVREQASQLGLDQTTGSSFFVLSFHLVFRMNMINPFTNLQVQVFQELGYKK